MVVSRMTAAAGACVLLCMLSAMAAYPAAKAKERADAVVSAVLPQGENSMRADSSVLPVQESMPELPQRWLLKLRGDTLYVYPEGSREAEASYAVPAGLPDYDRILLEYGMPAGSEEELRRLIEDYVS